MSNTENTQNASQGNGGHSDVCSRIQELRASVVQAREDNCKRRKINSWVGIGLVVFASIYLTFLCTRIFQLDAEALTEFGRLEVERQLPDGVQSLEDYLTEEAPTICSQVIRSLATAIPTLRQSITEETLAKNDVLMSRFDEELSLLAAEVIKAGRERLDAFEGEQTDIEKMEHLGRFVAEQLRKEVDDALDALYPEYAAQFSRIKNYLLHLQSTDADSLSERQRLEKELIETILGLLVKDGENAQKEVQSLFKSGF